MKRFFDFAISLIALILLSPVFITISLLIIIFLGRPIFFIQKRPGLHGKPFNMVKFRTMKILKDSDGNLLPEEYRLTKLGLFLRKSSLDELPELWNVLKGEMSLVGPRPLLMKYLPYYDDYQNQRHKVKPGITGWAQINGRNAITWDEKFALDVWYVKNKTFWLDLKILVLTIKVVFIRTDISNKTATTMPLFTGSKKDNNNENL